MSWQTRKYSAITVDPLHIGTGGERLGRVDLSIVREPVTKVPKIPGTTLSGAIKFFLDLKLRDEGIKNNICASTTGSSNKHDWKSCPVCYAFGYTPQENNNNVKPLSEQGILQFTDGLLLACPVSTATGPVWITTKPRLHDQLGIGDGKDDAGKSWLLPDSSSVSAIDNGLINLGQVVLEKGQAVCPSKNDIVAAGIDDKYAQRFVVISEWVFSHIVNSNMEVRTSVVIDPETGAAASKGLFTYEAVVRGSIFTIQITENDYKHGWNSTVWTGMDGGQTPQSAIDMIEIYALEGVRTVGLAGMTTRGFGRLDISSLP